MAETEVPEDTGLVTTDDGRAYVKLANGGLASVPTDQLDSFLNEGRGSLATAGEVAARQEQKKYGEGLGNELATFGESTLSGATLGLSDVAAKYIAPEYAEGLAKRREYNPTADTFGQGFGLIGSTIATGGESLLAKGASLATKPARSLMALGEAATGATARTLGAEAATGVLGQAMRQGAAYGVGGAVEGGLFGAAKQVTDDYLHDHEITAERVITGMGTGALWGGGLGVGLGATGSLIGSGAKKVKDLWSRTDADRAATGALDDVIGPSATATGDAGALAGGAATAEASVTAQTLSADQKIMQELGYRSDDQVLAELTLSPTAAEQQTAMAKLREMGAEAAAAKDYKTLQQDYTRSIVGRLNEVAKVQDDASRYLTRNKKLQTVKDQLDVQLPEWTPERIDSVMGRVSEIKQQAATLRQDSSLFTQTEHKALQDVIEGATQVEKRLGEIKGAGPVQQGVLDANARVMRGDRDAIAETFMALDDLKGYMGRSARKAGRASPQVNSAEAAIQREYMALRSELENEELWGKPLATMQKMTNAVESEAIRTGRVFERRFVQDEGLQNIRSGEFGFDTLSSLDSGKIGGFLNNLGRAESAEAERDFLLGIQRHIDNMKTKADFYRLPDANRAEIARAEQLVQSVISDMRTLRSTKEMADRYADQIQSLRDIPVAGETLAKLKISASKGVQIASGLRSELSAAAEGGAATARSGGFGVGAAQSAIRAGITGEKAANSAARGVVKWLRSTGKATARTAERAARATTQAAKRGPLLGVSLAVGDSRGYEKLIRNVGALRDPQSDERKAVRAQLFQLRQQNPQLADALEAHTQRVADFLAEKAGQLSAMPRPGDPFGHLRPPRHDTTKAEKLARYVEAATNPRSAMERIEGGNIVREDIEVLQALYPRMYRRVVEDVLLELGEVDNLPDYDARLKLSHLLNAPADPSMRPDRLLALQAIAKSGAQPLAQAQHDNPGQAALSPSQRREPRVASLYETAADRRLKQ